jgi:hypothetical protein
MPPGEAAAAAGRRSVRLRRSLPAAFVAGTGVGSLTRPELIDLLHSAELLLAETGSAVALCPVYGDPATRASGAKTVADDIPMAGTASGAAR